MAYTRWMKAMARHLVLIEDHSTYKASAMLRQAVGIKDAPPPRQIQRWVEGRKMTGGERERLEARNLELADWADTLIIRKLAALEDDIDKVRLPELVMASGVFRDKDRMLRELELKEKGQHSGESMAERIALAAERMAGAQLPGRDTMAALPPGEVVEGTYTEVEDGDDVTTQGTSKTQERGE